MPKSIKTNAKRNDYYDTFTYSISKETFIRIKGYEPKSNALYTFHKGKHLTKS